MNNGMKACNDHKDFVVVHQDKENCPVCELIHDNFKMRMQLLAGARLANYDVMKLPKCIRQIFIDMSKNG